MQYSKRPLSSGEHITKLKEQGLIIHDDLKAENYLNNIGYFRLSAYFSPFYNSTKNFLHDTCFDDIMALYIFDRKLRIILMDVLGRIEIGIRTCISNTMALETKNPHWYLDQSLFSEITQHARFIIEVEKNSNKNSPNKQNNACKHYYQNYTEPNLPPSWLVAECLPMGVWSKLFSNIKNKQHKRKIASHFGFSHKDFELWIHALTVFRNTIAHHSRFWNIHFPPIAKNVGKYTYTKIPLNLPYTNFVIIHAFMKRFIPTSDWVNKLDTHLQTCPLSINTHMGFPIDWRNLDFWK